MADGGGCAATELDMARQMAELLPEKINRVHFMGAEVSHDLSYEDLVSEPLRCNRHFMGAEFHSSPKG